MPVKAIACITDIERTVGSNQAVNLAVTAVVLGAELGNYTIPEVKMLATNIDVSSPNAMQNDVAAKVKAELQLNGVTFTASDSVQVVN